MDPWISMDIKILKTMENKPCLWLLDQSMKHFWWVAVWELDVGRALFWPSNEHDKYSFGWFQKGCYANWLLGFVSRNNPLVHFGTIKFQFSRRILFSVNYSAVHCIFGLQCLLGIVLEPQNSKVWHRAKVWFVIAGVVFIRGTMQWNDLVASKMIRHVHTSMRAFKPV